MLKPGWNESSVATDLSSQPHIVQNTDRRVRCLASNLSQEGLWPLLRARYEGLRVGKAIATAIVLLYRMLGRSAGRSKIREAYRCASQKNPSLPLTERIERVNSKKANLAWKDCRDVLFWEWDPLL